MVIVLRLWNTLDSRDFRWLAIVVQYVEREWVSFHISNPIDRYWNLDYVIEIAGHTCLIFGTSRHGHIDKDHLWIGSKSQMETKMDHLHTEFRSTGADIAALLDVVKHGMVPGDAARVPIHLKNQTSQWKESDQTSSMTPGDTYSPPAQGFWFSTHVFHA